MDNHNNFVDDILNSAEFDQIKEMLFCMDGLSCSDKEMLIIIVSNGGLDVYFQEVKTRYMNFLLEGRKNP